MKITAFLVGLSLILTSNLVSAEQPVFTTGPAKEINSGLFECGARARVSAVGSIKSSDGSEWTVPARTHFQTARKLTDLYNQCSGVKLSKSTDLDMANVPLLDAGGSEEFVMYLFADNYFELHVNGKLLGVDPVPFTPFNSNVVRFKADRPLTIAVKMVDWEENLGLGSERGRGSAYHPGDGGLVAHLKDAKGKTVALTDKSWRALSTYIAPLNDPKCLEVSGNRHDSSKCNTSGVRDGSGLSAAHWKEPAGWMKSDFDDTAWPMATTFTNDTVGVNNKRAYTNFRNIFDTPGNDADFIWSSNLILDNVVLLRKTVR